MFNTIKSSIWNPSFYKEIEGYTVGKSIKYYLKLCLLIAFFSAIVSIVFALQSRAPLNNVIDKFIALYPAELIIKNEKGIISTNISKPVVLSMEETFGDIGKNISMENGGIKYKYDNSENQDFQIGNISNFLVMDTSIEESPTVEQFKKADTLVLITKKYVVGYDENGIISFSSTSRYSDYIVTQEKFRNFLEFGRYIPYLIPIFFFVVVFFGTLFSLVGILFLSAVLFVVQMVMKNRMTFSNSFKTCVYASSAPLILSVILIIGNVKIPFLFSLATLLIAVINQKSESKVEPIQE